MATVVWGRSHLKVGSRESIQKKKILFQFQMQNWNRYIYILSTWQNSHIVSLSRRGRAIFETRNNGSRYNFRAKGRSGRIRFLRAQSKLDHTVGSRGKEGTNHTGSSLPALRSPAVVPLIVCAGQN